MLLQSPGPYLLKTDTKRQQVIALLALGWTFRRIECETVSRYARPADPNAAKVFPGSGAPDEGQVEDPEGVAGPNAAAVTVGPWANAAKVSPGSATLRSAAGMYHEAIAEKLAASLSAQRIWQDLVEDFGYGNSYESVKRYGHRIGALASLTLHDSSARGRSGPGTPCPPGSPESCPPYRAAPAAWAAGPAVGPSATCGR